MIDVKTAQPQLHKETGNNLTKCTGRNPEQVKQGVQLLMFNAQTRKLKFVKHRK